MNVLTEVVYDIVVVGGGMVGLPAALSLHNHGFKVALIDAADPGRVLHGVHKPAGANLDAGRCTAINLGTQQWYARQNMWHYIASDASPINSVQVSHKGYLGITRLHAEELDVPAIGFVMNNHELVRQMTHAVLESGLKVYSKSRLTSLKATQDDVVLQLAAGDPIRTRLVIAADGVSSVVRESLGIGLRQVDYQQVAILGSVKLQDAHDGTAFERFTDSGPLALLPRHNNVMSFADCINPEDEKTIQALSDEAYLSHLQDRFGYRLGNMMAVGPRISTPLVRIEAEKQVATRCVLMGNAVRLLHPVGGQGYNLAMRDVAQLIVCLTQEASSDPGDETILNNFASQRKKDQQTIVKFTDLLARTFRGKSVFPAHMRSAALLGLDLASPLRTQFAKLTMGV